MDAIEEVLNRGVEKIYPNREGLAKVLRSGKKLRLYQGFDPSGIQLHIGHLVGLMKLRQFQKLGHHVIFLIGDGTGQAGDPSGKTRSREKYLTREELRQNAKDYVMQAGKILDFKGNNPVEILYNSDWLNKLTLVDILDIAGHFSLQQLEERDLFNERKKEGREINFREFLYPLLQGYDSVAMKVDLEIGGDDQMFNMLAGRKLVKEMRGREKFVLTTPLLTDNSGHKIGKTEGNVIALTSKPEDLFGMIMNLPDDVISKCFEYITTVPMEEVTKYSKAIADGENPMVYKKKLAFNIVEILNNATAAKQAREFFENTFQKKQVSETIPEIKIDSGKMNIIDLILKADPIKSRSEAKRLVKEKAVDIDGITVDDPQIIITVNNGMVIRIGKHRFVKVLL
ncbi:tyrosine--tRNA ligase [Candidatus Microgenomates bacterium]|nr:tyrosine--tRNA ligase [Candidatus Microgenomates bacterium]